MNEQHKLHLIVSCSANGDVQDAAFDLIGFSACNALPNRDQIRCFQASFGRKMLLCLWLRFTSKLLQLCS